MQILGTIPRWNVHVLQLVVTEYQLHYINMIGAAEQAVAVLSNIHLRNRVMIDMGTQIFEVTAGYKMGSIKKPVMIGDVRNNNIVAYNMGMMPTSGIDSILVADNDEGLRSAFSNHLSVHTVMPYSSEWLESIWDYGLKNRLLTKLTSYGILHGYFMKCTGWDMAIAKVIEERYSNGAS